MDKLNRLNNGQPSPVKKPVKASDGAKKAPVDSVDLNSSENLSLMEKCNVGWDLLAERLYDNKTLQSIYVGKKKLFRAIASPFKKVFKKIKSWAVSDDEEAKEIREEGKKNLENFKGKLKDFPSEKHTVKPEKAGNDEFWERHPILHSIYLGYRAVRKIPKAVTKMMLKIPKMLFKIVFPAVYSEAGKNNFVGAEMVRGLADKARKMEVVEKAIKNYQSFLKIPGVSIAMGVMCPLMGANRVMDGFFQYREGVKKDDAAKRLEGKVEMVTGGLYAIKPLALFAIVTEGAHAYLNYRVAKKGLDPAKADAMMTRAFLAATAPLGLAAYALLAPKDGKKGEEAAKPTAPTAKQNNPVTLSQDLKQLPGASPA